MNESAWNVTVERWRHALPASVPCHEHWLRYPPPRPEVHYALGTVLLLVGTTGTLGNSLVLFVFTRFRRLRGPASSFIVNLAVADLCNSLLHSLAAASAFRGHWSFGGIGCVLYACGVGYFGLLSIVTLAAIAVERYMVITAKPFSGNWKITQYGARKVCVLVWCYCLCMSLPPLLGWSRYVAEGFLTSCSWDYLSRNSANRAYYIYLLGLGFVLPVGVIAYCYTFILAAIYAHGREMDAVKNAHTSGYHRGGSAYSTSQQDTTHARPARAVACSTHKTAEIILKLVVLFLLSWTPYSVISFLGQFGDASLVTPWSAAISALFAKASVVYNPIVYGLSHPHFRSSIRTYLSSCAAAPSNHTAMLRPNSPTLAPTALVALRAGAAAAVAAAHRSQVSLLKVSEPHHMHLRCSGACGSASTSRDFLSEPADPERFGGGCSSNRHLHQQMTLHHVTLHWQNQGSGAEAAASSTTTSAWRGTRWLAGRQVDNETLKVQACKRCPPPRAVCVVYEGGHVCCHVTRPLSNTCSTSLGHLPRSASSSVKSRWDSSLR